MNNPLIAPADNPWYYDYLDRIANLELKNRPAQQGGTALRYNMAREQQGGTPLCQQVAQKLLHIPANSTVILVTGTGNPIWLPHGETDGPSGVSVLAQVFATLGVRTCVLSEDRFLPGITASVQAGGTPLLPEASWRQRTNTAMALPFPTSAQAAGPFIQELLDRLPNVVAGFFIEKPGPNANTIFHNSSGKPKDSDWLAHAHLLVRELRERGALTVGVGDGGNEIGFGNILKQLLRTHAYDCQCEPPCDGGLLDSTVVDILMPASVSNWGSYAIAAAIALINGRPALLPDWADVYRSIAAPLSYGAFDGYSGMARDTVDNTSHAANAAIYQLMAEVLRLAGEQP